MPRKTSADDPADWLWIAASDMDIIRLAAERELSFISARSKLAEALEKIIKAELIRLSWPLVKTHDLVFLAKELRARNSDLTDTVQPLVTGLAEVYMLDRYPGFDLDDPDWPKLRAQVEGVTALLEVVKSRLPSSR